MLQAPPDVENGNLEADGSPGPPVPPSSQETCIRVDPFVPGTSYCRGTQGQRRQNQTRGPRRGAKSRPQHRTAVTIPENLEKLSLSSDCMEGSNSKSQGCHNRQIQGNPEACWEDSVVQQDVQFSADHQAIYQSALGTESPKDVSGRGHGGRRRGPHRHVPHAGASAPAWHHCDGQASRSRGGGHRRGHGRSFQRKVVERGREEVL